MATQWYVQRNMMGTDMQRVWEEWESLGPFHTEAEARRAAIETWKTLDHLIFEEAEPLPGMVECPTCHLFGWPDHPHNH